MIEITWLHDARMVFHSEKPTGHFPLTEISFSCLKRHKLRWIPTLSGGGEGTPGLPSHREGAGDHGDSDGGAVSPWAANGDSRRLGLSPRWLFPLAEGNSDFPPDEAVSPARNDAPRQRWAPVPGSAAKLNCSTSRNPKLFI